MTAPAACPRSVIEGNVAAALAEDLGGGDVTAALVPAEARASAEVVTRRDMTLAGSAWVDEVYRQLDPGIRIEWRHADGDAVAGGEVLAAIHGPARALLSGERTALNFLQLLSGTATTTAAYVAAVAGTGARILDTRKTIPGLRLAQKYAVRCGGGVNHRVGLFDAILIKENHIHASGGIGAAVALARERSPGLPVEVEVESLAELRQALAAGAERLLLDNFGIPDLAEAVRVNRAEGKPPAELEASGGLGLETIREVAATGVDYISVGALTKHVQAADLSLRFVTP